MKINSISIKILILTMLFSIIMAFIFNSIDTGGIVYNIFLGIFGSSVVTFITSIIGYNVEKKKELYNLFTSILKQTKYLNGYMLSWSTDKKCKFFVDYYFNDYQSIVTTYSNICFFTDFKSQKHKTQIYNNLCKDCIDIENIINRNYYDFSLFLNGTGKNATAINKQLLEIENKLFKETNGVYTNFFCTEMKKKLDTFLSDFNNIKTNEND